MLFPERCGESVGSLGQIRNRIAVVAQVLGPESHIVETDSIRGMLVADDFKEGFRGLFTVFDRLFIVSQFPVAGTGSVQAGRIIRMQFA